MDCRFSIRSKRKIANAAAAAAITALTLSCDMFLPATGLPEEGPNARSTPEGVIEQLFRSYEDRRIDLFTELLPKNGTYRFFISPEYSLTYSGTDAILETINENQYRNVRAGNYHYWGQESEIAKHRRLFSRAEEILFREPPIIQSEFDFKYTIDDATGDTTHVELRLTAGELCIGFRDTLYCTPKEGQMQVFLLEREREADKRTGVRLWVIKDWFDLDYL